MKTAIKRCIGRALINIANGWPRSKPFLKSLGMRTSQELFSSLHSVDAQTPTGETLKLTNVSINYLSFQVFWMGTIYYEPITTMVIQDLLRPNATFVDVGANIGFFSLVISLTKPGIKVIAFEPNPKNYLILKDNIRTNRFENIHCEPLAVSDVGGKAKLYLNASDMSASLLADFQKETNPALKSIVIQTTTLDHYFDKHFSESPLVLKIDVEGHEVALLRGAQRLLRSYMPDIILEVLKPYPDEVISLFKELGYKLYTITGEGLLQSKSLFPMRRGDLFFLNYLISKRPEGEITAISEKIVAKVKDLDLRQTSKYCGPQTNGLNRL